jgi:DivIVA domain-containing protein
MMDGVSSTFPTVPKGQRGYDVTEVEAFLAEARAAYTGGEGQSAVDSARIRRTAFAMRKGGYSPAHVDQALERLEDAFASRERDRAGAGSGDAGW